MKIVPITYQGSALQFQDDGWFNATVAASARGRRVDKWLKTKETQEYIAALCRITNTPEKGYLKTKRGAEGGTWLHPKLAVRFAQWIDPEFAIWCDAQIDGLIRGKTDWRKERSRSASSFKVMNDILKISREESGKDTASHHYSNEARLINFIVSGEFKSLDRDALPHDQIELLAYLEERNTVLLGRNVAYDKRKALLAEYATDFRIDKRLRITKAA